MKILKNTIIATILLLIFAVLMIFTTYIYVLPKLVSNSHFIGFIKKEVKKSLNVELIIKNPTLKTSLKPKIEFSVEKIFLSKGEIPILKIQNLDTEISFAKILSKTIKLERLVGDEVFVDVNSLLDLFPQTETQEQTTFDKNIDWFNSLFALKKLSLIYKVNDNTLVNLSGKDLKILPSANPKYIHFNILANIKKGKDNLVFSFCDDNRVFVQNEKIYLKDFSFDVNNSKILLNANADVKGKYSIVASSKKFDVKNIVNLLNSNILIPYGSEIMSYFKDVKGSFDFNVKVSNDDISGKLKLNQAFLKIVPACNLPIKLSNALVYIGKKDITIKDIKATFANTSKSYIDGSGEIKNYATLFNANFLLKGYTSDDFTKNYASKLANLPIDLTSPARTIILINANEKEQNIKTYFKIPKGQDILFDGVSISPKNYDRVILADMLLKNNILNLNKIDYYIDKTINKNSKISPVVNMFGKLNIANGMLHEFGFKFTKPLPSEFLNVLAGQRVFRKGLVNGNLTLDNYGKFPTIKGNFTLENVRIPSQRMYIKSGKLTTNKDFIHLTSNGRFQRSNYAFDGDIKNAIIFPIIVEKVNLSLDELDVERFMNSMIQKPVERPNVLVGPAARSLRTQKQPETINSKSDSEISLDNFEKIQDIRSEIESTSDLRLLGMRVLPPSVEINNPQPRRHEDNTLEDKDENSSNEPYVFNPNLLVIKNCLFNLKHGSYKELEFGNLKADLTLDNKGILQVKSNKFDFAEGTSGLKVYCDLIKQKYAIRLGAKQVNSDVLATNLLGLRREISGKVAAIIELNTDETLKMNGGIKFKIKNGSISKMGYIEYILNFVSLFRNPVAMINPVTIFDLTNIPDGTFNNINGELKIKDNVIKRLIIKSSSPQLSSFIIGQINLETFDSSLRIYTKFSNKRKGLVGVMRNISLNSIANKIQAYSSQDSIIYSSEISQIPLLENEKDEKNSQVFVTKVDGDLINNNFISSLKKLK